MTTTQNHTTVTTTTPTTRPGLVVAGLAAAVTGAAVTTVVAALAMAVGVDFELPDGGESVPLTGFTVITFMFSIVGVAIAVGLRRWSRHPRTTFVRVAVTLTALSLVPPFFQDADAGTVAGLVLLHLTAAAIVIPLLSRRLEA